MNRENKIEQIMNSTQGIKMPEGSEFMYTRIESRLSGDYESRSANFRRAVRKRILIGSGVLAINSLVLVFSLSGNVNASAEATDSTYNMDQAVAQFYDTYQNQLNYGVNEK